MGFKSRIKACHPREMDGEKADGLPTCQFSIREEGMRHDSWGVITGHLFVFGWAMLAVSTT